MLRGPNLSPSVGILAVLILSTALFSMEKASLVGAQRKVAVRNERTRSAPRRVRFPDAGEKPIDGWTGPVFQLSQDYPKEKPTPDAQPWKKYDFSSTTEWKDYLSAVLHYCMEGNLEADWVPQNNEIRRWYHAPWMHWGVHGREFVHGLTHERVSLPGELAPLQRSSFQNWAVGLYNPLGGWVLGRVWADPDHPDPDVLKEFPDGTVSIKLLFTQADSTEVPYLNGSIEWDAYIYQKTEVPVNPSGVREIRRLRLLQVDTAIRDVRNDSNTGWVFGTFTYNGSLQGEGPYDKLVPIGIMWGNDPEAASAKDKLKQTIINASSDVPPQHLGWSGRLNGPVDNPLSSCLSCHSTAEWPVSAPLVPPRNAQPGSNEWMSWFRNIKSGEPFVEGSHSLDYSLQLATGIQNFYRWKEIVETRGGAINATPFVVAGGTTKDRLARLKEWVMQLFGQSRTEGLQLRALFQLGGKTPQDRQRLSDAVKELASEGILEQRGSDIYALSEKGKRAVKLQPKQYPVTRGPDQQ